MFTEVVQVFIFIQNNILSEDGEGVLHETLTTANYYHV